MPGIGCARPHLLQVGNATLLVSGRTMMGPHYGRSFNVWMSQDGGDTWEWASGSYHHNEKAKITGAPLWPEAVNKTGWRFEFTSGYIGLVRVAEMSAMVLYDFMVPVGKTLPEAEFGSTKNQSGSPILDDFDDVYHNPGYDFAMRIDLIPKGRIPAVWV